MLAYVRIALADVDAQRFCAHCESAQVTSEEEVTTATTAVARFNGRAGALHVSVEATAALDAVQRARPRKRVCFRLACN